MTVFVDAWDTRTGQKLRNANGGKVPLSWITSGLFPYLTDRPPEPPQAEQEDAEQAEPAETPAARTGRRSQSAASSGNKEQ